MLAPDISGDTNMLNTLTFAFICAAMVVAIADFTPKHDTTSSSEEIARIDPSKTLELIRRIKTASGDVAS